MKKKVLSIVAVVLVFCCAIGGTLAWLTAKSDVVTNTFAPSDINITLTETPNTDTDGNGENDAWKADMIPGFSYTKDPVVTVKGDSVDCYLFVKFEEKGNPATYLTYTSTLTAANGWTQGDSTSIPSNVWYRVVKAGDTTKSWNLLDGNTIAVNDTLTKTDMPTTAPELVYTAYATQLYKSNGVEFTAAEAWDNAPKG